MLIELTGHEILAILISLGVAIIVSIRLYRVIISRKETNRDSSASHKIISLSNRTKYPSKNVLRHRTRKLGIGLISSLSFAIIAMSWTIYEPKIDHGPYVLKNEIDEIEVVPRTAYQKPTPPPPPQLELTEVIPDDLIEEYTNEVPEEVVEEVVEEVEVSPTVAAAISEPAPPPPPLPIIEEEVTDLPFKIVEQMPLFGGCTNKECSDKALMEYIYRQVKYPAIARESNIEGRVTAEFVVERDGYVSGIKILKGIGAGCNREVLKVMSKMNDQNTSMWTPGKQRGKAVRVLYRMPVTFKLSN